MQQFCKRLCVVLVLTVAPIFGLSAQAQAEGHATVHEVTIKKFKFMPDSLEVKVGDSLRFTNEDGAPHTATTKGDGFDTGRLNRGDDAVIEVTAEMMAAAGEDGSLAYVCAFHPMMKAALTIMAGDAEMGDDKDENTDSN